MASPTKDRGFESLKRSWSSPQAGSPRASPSPKTQTPSSPIASRGSSSLGRGSPSSASMNSTMNSSFARAASPRRRATSPKSRGRLEEVLDGDSTLVGTTGEMDARCTLAVGDHIWVGERSGDISIRNGDGNPVHIIERRKGAFVWCLALAGSYVWAGCSDGFIRVLSASTFKMERQFARHAGGGGGVYAMAYHGPSNVVFSGSNDFEILAWNASSGEFIRQLPLSSGVRALIADTHLLYAATDSGHVNVFDILSGEKVQQWSGHSRSVLSMCTTDSFLWSGSEDGTIRIWNPSSGECVGVAEVHTGAVTSLTAVGNKVWSGAGDTVCLWDADKLKLLGTYQCHDGYVDTICVINKSAAYRVWTSGTDRALKLWHSNVVPDDSEAIKAKLARLAEAEYQNRVLKNELTQKDAKIGALEAELERRKSVDAENMALRQELKERDATIALLDNRIRAGEADVARLRSDLKDRDEEIARARAALDESARRERMLEADVAALRSVCEDLKRENAGLQGELAKCQADRAALEDQARFLEATQAENQRLKAEMAQLRAELDSVMSKLQEMDVIFKSRLSLVTEMFRVFKRFEKGEKVLRGNCSEDAKQAFDAGLGDFKTAIANHYTDDELAHLGSSRHFFIPMSPGSRPRSP